VRQHLGPTEWNPRHVTPSSWTFHSFRDTSLRGDGKGVGAVGYNVPVSTNVGTNADIANNYAAEEPSYLPFGKCLE